MRISNNMIYRQSLQNINNAQRSCIKTGHNISSGKIIDKPSDDPQAFAQIIRIQQSESCNQQYIKSRNLAEMGMKLQMDILGQMSDVMSQIDMTIIHASNLGTLNDRDNESLAEQLSSLKGQLITLGNTTDCNGRYIFAGFKSDKPPFIKNMAGDIQYQGGDREITQSISSNNEIITYFLGKQVFSTDKNNTVEFFKELDIGIAALKKSQENIQKSEWDIIYNDINKANRATKSALVKISNIEEKQGLQLKKIEFLNFQSTEYSIQNNQRISQLSESDLAKEITDFHKEIAICQASQEVCKNLNRLSLFN